VVFGLLLQSEAKNSMELFGIQPLILPEKSEFLKIMHVHEAGQVVWAKEKKAEGFPFFQGGQGFCIPF